MSLLSRLTFLVLLSSSVALISGCGNSSEEQSKNENSKETQAETDTTDPRELESPEELVKKVEQAIEIARGHYLKSEQHSPWEIYHGILAFRKDYELKQEGKVVNGLKWISSGVYYDKEPWFQKTEFGGRPHPYTKENAFEGHKNQSLAVLAMADVPLDHQFQTPDGPITVADIVRNAQKEIQENEEVTWSLWALVHYLGPDATWLDKKGEEWRMEDLVYMQNQTITNDSACGGTHALFALAYARNTYKNSGQRLRGYWLEADQKVQRYIEEARAMQNFDGSFSYDYFFQKSASENFQERLETTGHTLEFLMMALPDNRLNEVWVRRAISLMANDIINNRDEPVDYSALYHAIDGLVLYRNRMSPDHTAQLGSKSYPKNSSLKTDVKVLKPVKTPSAAPPAP
ncbi:MAG: hypothetical protein K0U86_02760 [Planctomycetes bacterium]|nr:hypothetical protein [Planctomycetota bacterium]MCH9776284.1 hypothetical protein [Planctomycetota bacterium]MCH9790480.1 hypothetical protein [Planctomycetota bacterium]MDF1744348.1 hypothetical protein [Gimesia sp.]